MLGKQAMLIAASAASAAAARILPQFTYTDMLTTPRPQPAIAAPGGKHALSVVDQWHEDKDAFTRTVYLLEPANTKAKPKKLFETARENASEFIWLSDTIAAYVNGSSLLHFSVEGKKHKTMHVLDFPEGSDPSGLQYEPESKSLVFSAAVWGPDGSLDDTKKGDEKWENRGNTGVVFDNLMVRHWDTWRVPGRVQVLAKATLDKRQKDGAESYGVKDDHKFVNLLKGTGLYSQIDPIEQFSLSPTHVALGIKDPKYNPAMHTRVDVFLIPIDGGKAENITPHEHGAIASLTYSPDHKKLAWLEMALDGYESDRNIVMVHTLNNGGKGKAEPWTSGWDRSPSSVTWGMHSRTLYITASYNGKVLPYHISTPGRLPTPLLFHGSTSSIAHLAHDKLLFSVSSMRHPTEMYFLDYVDEGDGDKQPPEAVHQVTHYSKKHIGGKLDDYKPEEMWFQGVDGRRVMAWTIKPRGWKAGDKKKWPMAFLIHGGPQSAWEDSWSTRWNPEVYSQAGYFVIAVNPTGSTGYGQDFVDRIKEHWGDRPFQDLEAGYHAALDKYPEIDPDRTVGLGASYGGYMVNWINGHNVFGFKALVCHDGIFDTRYTYYATEEVYFPNQDFGGSPITAAATFEKWNPANFVKNWKTPELVIHSAKDFRLDESQGISTFTALQLQGVESRFLYFPDENHWVLKPKNSQKWHHEVLTWIKKFVGNDDQTA